MSARPPPPLLGLTPGTTRREGFGALEHAVREAVEGGLRGVLLRERELSDRATLELLDRLRACLPPEGWLGVHDRAHLARAGRADGVHLGFRSLPPRAAREVVGADVALGFSAHEGDDPARFSCCDYLFFGPVRPTPSKQGLREPTGIEGLARAVGRTSVPVWAIGGLSPADARACLGAGARGIAVLSGVLGAPDPRRAARAYLEELARARASGMC